ncbi:MAG: nucleoside deaminase, partial [Bacteroidales bacterium]|nr:nucleoside deaminase [Bacteroidales bacterium]
FMNEALKEAMKAREEQEIPIGAVIVADNRIIARAHNQTEILQDVTAHAEMLAITAAANSLGAKYLNPCTLYVTLEPCTMCASATALAQLGKIVYGAKDPKAGYGRIIQDIIHPKTKTKSGVLEEKCSALLSDFFKNRR